MTYHFAIKFKQSPELLVQLNDTVLAKDWLYLFYRNCLHQRPLLRDQGEYTPSRMRQLANQCADVLGWDWVHDCYDDFAITTQMHKDIESYLLKGFSNVPKEHDALLHELHICLHSSQQRHARSTVQLEWFNDDGFSLVEYDFQFQHDDTLGAIWLQNPYVGHPPDWLWQQNDHTHVWQTCRFHDFVRPGCVIHMTGSLSRSFYEFDKNGYLAWWQQVAPEFLAHHGRDKMLHNTGHPVIGYVVNNQDLVPLQNLPYLQFESVRFNADIDIQPVKQTYTRQVAISEQDYENMRGPDWPAYQIFRSDPDSFVSVVQELRDLTGTADPLRILKSS